MLFFRPLKTIFRGEDLFKVDFVEFNAFKDVLKVICNNNVAWEKIVGVCTYGGLTIVGS